MRLFSLFLLLGTLIIQSFTELQSWKITFFLLLISIVFYVILKNKNPSLKLISGVAVAFFTGFFLASFQASQIIDERLFKELESQELLITATVHNIPTVKKDGTRFLVDVIEAQSIKSPTQKIQMQGIIRLGWFQHQQAVQAGETWQFKVKLKRPSGFMNEGGFDYEKWLFTQRIIATGYVRKSKNENILLEPASKYSVNNWRQNIHHSLQKTLHDKSAAAVLSALLVAVRSDLTEEQWQLFQDTGTSHLVAISGLHIAVVTGFAFFPIMLIWFLFPKLNEIVPMRVVAAIVGVLFASIYAMLAGFTLPTQRALLMVIIALCAIVSRRHFNSQNILAFALVGVLILDPLAGMTISFWLSFLAVAIILFFMNRQNEKPRWLTLKLQLFLSLGMLPLSLLFFDVAPLLSPVANLIAIPWVSLLVVPISLLALLFSAFSTSISKVLFEVAAWLIEIFLDGLAFITHSPLSSITFSVIPSAYLIVAFLGLLLLFFPKGFPARWLGLVLMVPVFTYQYKTQAIGEFNYTLLDVGQGYASVLQTKNHTLVYDTGTRVSESFDIGKLVIEPYLRSKGIKTIDRLMISHEDIDHRGGADHLLNTFQINQVIRHKQLGNQSITACTRGLKWKWDGVNFEVLSPEISYAGNDNNSSCVLKVWNQHQSLLLTGDIQKISERILLKKDPIMLKADVMAVPHHGSKTSSTEDFLRAVSPEIALISAGYRSRFGHPKPTIIKRYKTAGIRLLDTVNSGAISLQFSNDENGIEANFYRKENAGFWSR